MKTLPSLPSHGVASAAIANLVPTSFTIKPTKVAFIGVGLKMHFVWADAVVNYHQAHGVLKQASAGLDLEVYAPDEPFESPEALLNELERLKGVGVAGIVLFHASYTAGEIGSVLGRWLSQNKMPLFSWAFPEPQGGRLTANSLCCQNFLLHILYRLDAAYQWMFQDIESPQCPPILRGFLSSVKALAHLNHGRLLLLGSGRVPGFYDAEADEIAVLKRFGLRFDRVDLVQVFDRAKRFNDRELRSVMDAVTGASNCGLNNVNEEQFFQTLRLTLGTLEIAAEQGYIGTAIRCWPDLWEHWGCAADGALSLINDAGLPAADETDMNGLITMAAMHAITNGEALSTLMDISLLDPSKNVLGFWHCGGSATRLVRTGTKFETRRHSIMENADEATAVGMLVEALLETGPVTVARYLAPDSASVLVFEGHIVESPMAFRGSYAEFQPSAPAKADQIMGTILDKGLDHHWVIGRGHFAEHLRQLNFWLDVTEEPISNSGGSHGAKRPRTP